MNVNEYLDKFPKHLRHVPAHRRAWTKNDVLMFALIYLQSSIRFDDDEPSLSQFHLDLADYGNSLIDATARRDAWIAPRESGKSTWIFKIIPIWLAAHGHSKFISGFSESASQAEMHLQTFIAELGSNELLKLDYPDLCRPKMSDRASRFVSQSRSQIQQANGFSFSAKGIDAKTLGQKIGNARPDLLLLDDIESDGSAYSEHEAAKRKHTMLSSIFYLSSRANIAIVGTTTMAGSLIDQLRTVAELRAEHAQQVGSDAVQADDKQTNHYEPIINNYVSLEKGNLNSADQRTSTSEALETIEHASSQSVTDVDKSTPESDMTVLQSAAQYKESVAIDEDLSSGTNIVDDSSNATQSLQLTDFAKSQLEQGLTHELTSAIGYETDLKSEISINPMSTTQTNIEEFENVEQLELERQGLVEPTNRAEHQLAIANVFTETLELDAELQWIENERIDVHYYPAIVVDSNGLETSWWPEFKSIDELTSQRHTAEFQLNMMNKPVNLDSQFWNTHDISIAEPDSYRFTLISIDPAISTLKTSDFTGISVLSIGSDGLVYVRHAEQLRLVSTELLGHVNGLIEQFDASVVVVETNQGGDVWRLNVFDGLKAKFVGIRQQEKKEVRASRALDYYRKNQVRHTRHFAALEDQMYAFPKVAHDDLVDSVGTGIHCLLSASGGMSIKKRAYT